MSSNQSPDIDTNIPFYCLTLAPEQAELVKHRELTFYEQDGQTMFPVKDKDGKETGEFAIYIVFKP